MILIESRAARDGSQTAPKRLEREADWEKRLPVEFLFHAVLADLPLPVFIKEAVGLQYIFWNRAGQELTGFTPAEFFGKSDYELFPKEQADRSAARDRSLFVTLVQDSPGSRVDDVMRTTARPAWAVQLIVNVPAILRQRHGNAKLRQPAPVCAFAVETSDAKGFIRRDYRI